MLHQRKKKNIARTEIVLPCSEILFAESIQSDCDVLAYVFMPDHCHILLQGKSDHADTLEALRSFKQKSGYWFSKNHHGIEWQKSFYDHILRTDYEIDKHMRYILENMSSTRKCNALKELVKLEYGTTQMLQPDNARRTGYTSRSLCAAGLS